LDRTNDTQAVIARPAQNGTGFIFVISLLLKLDFVDLPSSHPGVSQDIEYGYNRFVFPPQTAIVASLKSCTIR
jgi:hypothetical protein